MSDSMSIFPRPGLATRAKNASQRPGRILLNSRRARRSSAQVVAEIGMDRAVVVPRKASVAGYTSQHPKGHRTGTTLESKIVIEQQGSDGAGPANHSSSSAPTAVRKRAKIHPTLTCKDLEPESRNTSVTQVYDIVSIARMIVAGLSDPQREASMDCIKDTRIQSYAFHSYYFH